MSVPAIKENQSVNDISWANVDARSYHLLAVGTDSSAKIYEVQLKDPRGTFKSMDVLKCYELSNNPVYTLSWNQNSTMITIAEREKMVMFIARKRGEWEKIKEIEDQDPE